MKASSETIMLALAFILIAVACGNQKPGEGNLSGEDENKKSTKESSESTLRLSSSEPMKIFDFEDYITGQLPSGWSEYYSGSGGTEWKVTDDYGNKVMAQLFSDNPNNHFNVVVNDSITAKDLTLKVRFKGVTGHHDQGGGFVWRFTDINNYYVVRANPLEDNVVLYKVKDGNRTDLPLVDKGRTYGMDVPPMDNSWHRLKLSVKGDLFTVYLDDKTLFKVQDSTFKNAGKIGFWTKADAVTYFDDFKIEIE